MDRPARTKTAPLSAPVGFDDTEGEEEWGKIEMDDKYGKRGDALRASYMVNCTAPWDDN